MNKKILVALLINLVCALSGAPVGILAYTIPILFAAIIEKPGEAFIRKISGETDEDFIDE